MQRLRRLARDLGGLGIVVALMLLVGVLPPDTSLSEIRAAGLVRACVPTRYPPLVTGDPERPGIDVEILGAVAADLGVTLSLSPIGAMGRDFNPRNWGVNRARCQLLAGGVVDSPLTRSFMETGPPYAETGWAVLAPAPLESLEGRRVGALTLVSGLDRLGLSAFLRARDVSLAIARDGPGLVAGVADGTFDAGVTEALLAQSLAAGQGWWVSSLPADELTRYNLVLGLWKGDLTLKRAVVRSVRRLHADGTVAAILARYGVAPL